MILGTCRVSLLVLVTLSLPAVADTVTRADQHAPIGVMGDHYHHKGEWMLSYRFMSMAMDGNLSGSSGIGPDTIVTTVPNRFAGMPMQPPTLRVVPLEMTMNMHMFGAMYAPSDRVTLMLMSSYRDLDMKHVTYMGPSGTTVLGNFTTRSSGLGDTSLTGLLSLLDRDYARIHAIVGLSFPTGDTDETDVVLTPMNTQPTLRLPYPMQLGSGSYDPIIGASYAGFGRVWSWGAQWRSTYRLFDNDHDYQLGDEHRLTAWASYLWSDPVSTSLRLEHYRRQNVAGIDPDIVAPVQTADPRRQKTSRTDLAFGVNVALRDRWAGYRLAFEYSVPVQQHVAGPQLEVDSQFVLGLQKSF